MRLKEILCEVGNLDLYDPQEWQEYINSFTCGDEVLDVLAQQPTRPVQQDVLSPLLLRIKEEKGETPVQADATLSDKIKSLSELSHPDIRSGITLGIVSGCYDLLHLGHIHAMLYAKQFLEQYENPKLEVLTLSDENIRAKKGESRPILNLNERLEMICGVSCVDYAHPLEDPNCLRVLETLQPNYFFKASADRSQEIVRREMELVESYGGTVIVFPPGHGRSRSTTHLIGEVMDRLMREW